MPTYMVCYNYTDEGIRMPGASARRLPLLKQRVSDLGGRLEGFYLTMGMFDTVAIVAFPNDETVARFALGSASLGYVTTTTMKAFSEAEYLEIIRDLPGA
jgi:uncharacterized protein with GYD domain